MTKQELINWAKSRGYHLDKYGHLQKITSNGQKYRIKIQANSARFEKQITFKATQYSKAKNEWLRLNSGYLKDISITSDGKLRIGK